MDRFEPVKQIKKGLAREGQLLLVNKKEHLGSIFYQEEQRVF